MREVAGYRPLCDIEWSELHARKLSSGDVNSVRHRVIAVAVNARGRDQRQALGQFQGRMPQLGAPIGLRLVEAIDERILAELLEALQRNGRPRAIAQQPFRPARSESSTRIEASSEKPPP